MKLFERIIGCTPKEALGCLSAVCGLLLAGAEGPDLGAQIAVNLLGVALFAIPIGLAVRAQNRGNR